MKVFEEYAKYCDDEATEKGYAIKDSKEAIEEFTATITNSKAIIETETAKVGDLTAKISDTEGEVATSVALREKEKEAFVKVEAEMVETVEELAGAQKAIKKSVAFIQARGGKVSSQDREVINAVLESLGQIVQASFVTEGQKNKVAALLQAREDSEEDAEYGSGTMAVDAILETLGEMEDKAEASLTEARKGESDAQHSHAMLKQGLENEIKSTKEEKDEATKKSAAAAEALAMAEQDLATEKGGLAEDEKYLKDLKRDCKSRASEFEVTFKDNKAELEALGKATAIMKKKFASFVQTGATARMR